MRTVPELTFGTLPGRLATCQTQYVIERCQALHSQLSAPVRVLEIGADVTSVPQLPYLACSQEACLRLQDLLLAGECRCLVQRGPDLPPLLREGVAMAAVLERTTPYDSLLSRQGGIADELPAGAKVGALNIRTRSQLKALYPHLLVPILTGGVDAALESLLRRRDLDGLVLPAAVAEHLGIQSIVTEIFYPEIVLPGGGQGILAVLAREDDRGAAELLAPLHSEPTLHEMQAERAFAQRFAPDQDLPVGVLARIHRGRLHIEGAICSPRGAELNSHELVAAPAEAVRLGTELAERLLAEGPGVIALLEADFPDGVQELEEELVAAEGEEEEDEYAVDRAVDLAEDGQEPDPA
jgi:hydroxymethylbilane synthase